MEYSLALRYLNGEGGAVDLARARRHFENAAVFGHPFPDALRWVEC
ncbi:SEL1-like repeat protein [Subtercola sp. Z020]|nr:SEL1-like repeat protein [Subtercola sp. Z020]